MEPVFLAGIVDGLKTLGINLPSLLAQLINFTILLILLSVLAYRPVIRLLDERRQRIQEGLEAAEQAKEQAARAEQEVQAQLERARQEGQAIISQGQQIAARIQEEARQQARQDAEALLMRARSEIQLERDSAIAELRREFAGLTIAAAEKVIGQALDRQAHLRLIEEVLAESTLGGDGEQPRSRSEPES
ncbi:MAG: F0F1 ATP synthase subunit B [Dehalococcoidia bacterium]